MKLHDLHNTISANVAPLAGLSAVDALNPATYRLDFVDEVTPEQLAAAQALIAAFCAGTLVTADDVRAEAQRRMAALLNARSRAHLDILISNGTREAVRLMRKGADTWSAEEAARAAELEEVDAALEAIRAASNILEPNPPADFADDRHWP